MEDMILFNGRSSADFEMIVTEYPVLSRGVRRGDPYQIAGRNGTQIREDDTFENYTMTYKVAFPEDRGPSVTTAEIARWLLGSSGFCRLEDTFESDFYRLARYAGPLNISQLLDKCGEAPLTFDCQPERYLKTGEQPILAPQAFLSSADGEFSIANPTAFAAEPVIHVVGSGIVHFKIETDPGTPWTTFYLDLGSEIQGITIDCKTYKMTAGDGSDFSSHATIASSDGYKTLPKLLGTTNIRKLSGSGNLQGLAITPRWWTV